MGGSANSLRSTFSLPLSPPVPTAAWWFDSTTTMRVAFDQLLQPGTSATGNWEGCIQGAPRTLTQNPFTTGTILHNTVTIPMLRGAICFGVDRVEYFATPPDVLGRTGVPVAPFSGFPVTFVP